MKQKPVQTALKTWKPVSANHSSSLLFVSSPELNKLEHKEKKAAEPSSEMKKIHLQRVTNL